MICSTSSSGRAAGHRALLLLALLLPSCALWSQQAAAPLECGSLTSDSDGRPATRPTSIRWSASCSGGSGDLVYEWKSLGDSAEIIEQVGPSPTWDWSPIRAGTFRVMVTVEDSTGARVGSDWSEPIVILPAAGAADLIAVLPAENLTGWIAPVDTVDELLRARFVDRGFRLVDDATLASFMERHRIRDTGGVTSRMARASKDELGAGAVLVTSLELFRDAAPPRVALFARLVSSGDQPEIAWMDSVGMSGDGHLGLLALGRIGAAGILLEKSIDCLTASLARSLPELVAERAPLDLRGEPVECDSQGEVVALPPGEVGKRRYRPQTAFRAPLIDSSRRYSVAIVPFANATDRKYAGTLIGLHFINQMVRNEHLTVVEPGLVREALLENRVIMRAGPSLENAEALSSDETLGVDLVLSGTVFDYQDSLGTPKVEFSVNIIERSTLKVVWASHSYNTGVDGVLFFGLGTVHTAHQLASRMARGTFEVMTR